MPTYRNYLLSKLGADFQKYFQETQKGVALILISRFFLSS